MSIPIYSVVVPVYKTEAYICDCVESVLRQEGDIPFELILVDNGSPDCAGDICEEYAARDPRIKVIHQENRNPGGGRNTGLRAAIGRYVIFMDSDDMWDENLLSSLQPLLLRNADIMVFGFCNFEENGCIKNNLYH